MRSTCPCARSWPSMSHQRPPRFGIWSLKWGSLVWRHFGGLLSICSKSLKYVICADSLDLGAGARVAQPSPAPQLRWNDLGGYPCRRGDLGRTHWNPCDVFRSRLIPEYGGSCAVRERAGQVAVKACGSASERPPIKGCNDVAVDGFVRSGLLFPCFLPPSAFRLLYVALRAKK